MVELRGFEPMTFPLRTRRATNYATAPSHRLTPAKRTDSTLPATVPTPGKSEENRPQRSYTDLNHDPSHKDRGQATSADQPEQRRKTRRPDPGAGSCRTCVS